MRDLAQLVESEHFDGDPAAPTALALVHRSFRSVGVARGDETAVFRAHFPALGLLNLAIAVRRAAAGGEVGDVGVRYFDEDAFADAADMLDAMQRWLATTPRRIVAASSYTQTIDVLEAFLDSLDPERYLILVGGAHASVAPDISSAHISVRGEGGSAIVHILRTFHTPEFSEGRQALGMNYVIEGRKVASPPAFDRSLEALAPPAFAFDLLPQSLTTSPVYATSFTRMLGSRPQIYVCTQSCRARCSFCSTYIVHGRTVARPVAMVREDLRMLIETTGCDSIEFHDDDLAQHPEFDALLEVVAETGLPWFCYMRVDGVTRDRARDLAAAG